MRRWLLLILGVIVLFLIPSLILQFVYGPSYGFLSYNNHWVPDGQGGWQAKGFPDTFRPSAPSVNVPLFLRIIPFALPLLLILLYIISPLSQYVEREPDFKSGEYKPDKYYPEYEEPEPDDEFAENKND